MNVAVAADKVIRGLTVTSLGRNAMLVPNGGSVPLDSRLIGMSVGRGRGAPEAGEMATSSGFPIELAARRSDSRHVRISRQNPRMPPSWSSRPASDGSIGFGRTSVECGSAMWTRHCFRGARLLGGSWALPERARMVDLVATRATRQAAGGT